MRPTPPAEADHVPESGGVVVTALDLGRFFQVGYVTHDLDVASDYLTGTLGAARLTRFTDFRSPSGAPSSIRKLSHFSLGGTEVELIEPRDTWPGSIYLDALPTAGQVIAVHHIGYLLDSRGAWHRVMDDAAAAGIAAPSRGETADVCFAYLDTRPSYGLYTEVVFRETGVGPGGVRSAQPRTRPPHPQQEQRHRS